MLILKAYLNDRLIEEIHIQNVEDHCKILGHKYKIIKPKGFKEPVRHHRYKGWIPLAIKILQEIEDRDD